MVQLSVSAGNASPAQGGPARMQAMIQWDDLRVLLAAHRGHTLAGAGRALGVDATTVGRRLHALEETLGTRLVERTPDGLVLTDAGLRAVAVAEEADARVTGLSREISGADARVAGTVRLTAGEGILVHVLAPALPALAARHPELRLELIASTRPLDLARREADLAVRLFRPREPGLVTKKLAPLAYGLYAAPAYLARRGEPRRTADLDAHDLIGFDAALSGTPEMRWLARHAPEGRFAVRASTTPVLLAACRAGLGILAVAEIIARGEPGIVRVLPRVTPPEREAWAVLHPDLRGAARVSAVLAWLDDVFARKR
ncbi:Transcriptional regulator, LysR family protein [Minicystis rosea]|nr:Transcriptional regulator, LysR family protein [Minicystis rosea]